MPKKKDLFFALPPCMWHNEPASVFFTSAHQNVLFHGDRGHLQPGLRRLPGPHAPVIPPELQDDDGGPPLLGRPGEGQVSAVQTKRKSLKKSQFVEKKAFLTFRERKRGERRERRDDSDKATVSNGIFLSIHLMFARYFQNHCQNLSTKVPLVSSERDIIKLTRRRIRPRPRPWPARRRPPPSPPPRRRMRSPRSRPPASLGRSDNEKKQEHTFFNDLRQISCINI